MGGTRFLIVAACLAALAACQQPKPGPDAAIRAVYAVAAEHVGKDATPLEAIPMTDELRDLMNRASAEADRRQEPFIDGDLVAACQDCGPMTDLQIATTTPPANGRAVVQAQFKMYDDARVINWDMVETPQGWRVDNIRGPEDFDLRKAAQDELNQPAASADQASCVAERGAQAAATLVAQCIEVSPATHPPCNAENACAMIEGEIARSCALLDNAHKPAFCAAHPAQ